MWCRRLITLLLMSLPLSFLRKLSLACSSSARRPSDRFAQHRHVIDIEAKSWRQKNALRRKTWPRWTTTDDDRP